MLVRSQRRSTADASDHRLESVGWVNYKAIKALASLSQVVAKELNLHYTSKLNFTQGLWGNVQEHHHLVK